MKGTGIVLCNFIYALSSRLNITGWRQNILNSSSRAELFESKRDKIFSRNLGANSAQFGTFRRVKSGAFGNKLIAAMDLVPVNMLGPQFDLFAHT